MSINDLKAKYNAQINTQISDLTSKLKETEAGLEKYSFLQVFPERLKSRREKEQ